MKKLAILLLSLCLCPALALGEAASYDGAVRAARTKTLLAPYSGAVSGLDAEPGDALTKGDALLSLSTNKVYAEFSGTVAAVLADPGDDAASVAERRGALVYIERDLAYTAACTTSGAGSENENKLVHPGERVFLRSSEDSGRDGEGVVTRVSGAEYTVEVTRPGNLRYNERVRVYRSASFRSDDCIGSGALSRVDPVPVTAEGYVLAVHVTPGAYVFRGDLVLETVPEAQDGLLGGDGTVAMPEDGVLLSVATENGASVAKDAVLATYCPKGALEVVCAVDEDDLSDLSVGDAMRVTLDAYPDAALQGTLTEISGVGAENGGRVTFDVRVALEENALARVGMSATAEKLR